MCVATASSAPPAPRPGSRLETSCGISFSLPRSFAPDAAVVSVATPATGAVFRRGHATHARTLTPGQGQALLAPFLRAMGKKKGSAARPTEPLDAFARVRLSGLAWRGDDPELLHQAQGVPAHPVLRQPAAREPPDVDGRYFHPLAGRRDAHQLAVVRPAQDVAHHSLVAFGDQLLDLPAGVGEGAAEHADG